MTWPDLARSMSVGGALPCSLAIVPGDDGPELYAEMTVPDTATGEPTTISRRWTLPRIHVADTWRRKQWLRECVHWLYRHEADEQITFSGVREFYPDHEHAA